MKEKIIGNYIQLGLFPPTDRSRTGLRDHKEVGKMIMSMMYAGYKPNHDVINELYTISDNHFKDVFDVVSKGKRFEIRQTSSMAEEFFGIIQEYVAGERSNIPQESLGINDIIKMDTIESVHDVDSFISELIEDGSQLNVYQLEIIADQAQKDIEDGGLEYWIDMFKAAKQKDVKAAIIKAVFETGQLTKDVLVSMKAFPNDILRGYAFYSTDSAVALNRLNEVFYKSLPRKTRRAIVNYLNTINVADDVDYQKTVWKKVFKVLHVSEYNLSENMKETVFTLRNNKPIPTAHRKYCDAMESGDVVSASKYLPTGMGFIRNLNEFLVLVDDDTIDVILEKYQRSLKNLTRDQMIEHYGFMKGYYNPNNRVIIKPDGTSARVIPASTKRAKKEIFDRFFDVMKKEAKSILLVDKDIAFYVEPELKRIMVPTKAKATNFSDAVFIRGNHVPYKVDGKDLRLFLYWKGNIDVDLSCTLYDSSFLNLGHVSYTNLSWQASIRHSGDILSAPKGDSEYIKVDIDRAKRAGVRFITMEVHSYSNVPFNEMEECFVGATTKNGKITSTNADFSLEVKSDAVSVLIGVFDIQKEVFIVTDISNNIIGRAINTENFVKKEDIIKAIIGRSVESMSVAEYLNMAYTVVDKKDDADAIVGINDLDMIFR